MKKAIQRETYMMWLAQFRDKPRTVADLKFIRERLR